MVILNIICYVLTIIGGLNWGLVGIFDFNLVSFITAGYRTPFGIVIYVLIALAAIWLIIAPFLSKGHLSLCMCDRDERR